MKGMSRIMPNPMPMPIPIVSMIKPLGSVSHIAVWGDIPQIAYCAITFASPEECTVRTNRDGKGGSKG